MSLLSIRHLDVYFKQKNVNNQVVKDVNLNLEHGEVLGLVGESGSGKSVTALSILGLLPYPKASHSARSSIKFNNQELIGLSDKELQDVRGNKISVIFQEPMSSLNPLHKIGKQIAEVLYLHQNLSKKEIEEKTLKLLRSVKIPEPEIKINAYPFELSGGQRQRVMIAMAIANNPQILIADEPTTALDVTVQEQIIDLLLELKQKMNMAIIFISHNLRLVNKISDNIAVMYQGKIVEYGEAERVFNSPQHSYTKKLISSNLLLNLQNNYDNNVVLKAENIKVNFPLKKNFLGSAVKKLQAVDDVSFSLNKGETLGIVGESGSGKTTLAMAMVNLVKYNGKILLKNNGLLSETQKSGAKVQIVFQDPYNSLNPRMNILQIVKEGLDVHYSKLSTAEKVQRVKKILKAVDLSEDALLKYPHEFSGGQRQRISLARAIILNPEVVILDEPTSALDVTIQAQVIELLKKLQKEYKISYIFISHDMNAVRAMSHKILVMKNGKIVESGTTEDIFTNPQHGYTKQLIKASIL